MPTIVVGPCRNLRPKVTTTTKPRSSSSFNHHQHPSCWIGKKFAEAEINLSESWTNLFLNLCEHYLQGHDVTADGPIPQLDRDFASAEELPTEQPPSSNQGESVTRQGKIAQETAPPTPTEETAHNQVPLTQQQPTQPSTKQQSASQGVGWHDVKKAPP